MPGEVAEGEAERPSGDDVGRPVVVEVDGAAATPAAMAGMADGHGLDTEDPGARNH